VSAAESDVDEVDVEVVDESEEVEETEEEDEDADEAEDDEAAEEEEEDDVDEVEAEEDELDEELDEDVEEGAEAEVDAEDVPVGVSGGEVEGEDEAERFSRADVSNDFPFAKKPFDVTDFSTAALPSVLCPPGETGCEEEGLAAVEETGDLTDGETGMAIARSSGVGLLDLGCV